MSALLFIAATVAATIVSICVLLIVANPDRSEEEAELAALNALNQLRRERLAGHRSRNRSPAAA